MDIVDTGNPAVLGYWREVAGKRFLCLLNLTDRQQAIALDIGNRVDRAGRPFDGIHVAPRASYQLVQQPAQPRQPSLQAAAAE